MFYPSSSPLPTISKTERAYPRERSNATSCLPLSIEGCLSAWIRQTSCEVAFSLSCYRSLSIAIAFAFAIAFACLPSFLELEALDGNPRQGLKSDVVCALT